MNSRRVTFRNFDLFSKFYTCPVCSLKSSKVKLQINWDASKLKLIACSCGSVFFPSAKAPDYQLVEDEVSFYMRLDQAEGIDAAVSPLFVSPALDDFAVVDIGCGLGFSSDFIKFMGRELLSFDPSTAAKLSNDKLCIKILDEYATKANTKTERQKIAYASEVIEHVDDPLEFLVNLKAIVGDNGYAVITTPNANYITKDTSTELIYSMLAPSQHLFLLSELSLNQLAIRAGFIWVKTWTADERLFMVAGPQPVVLKNTFSRVKYIEYLETQLNTEIIESTLRHRAFGYRLFKEQVNAGDYEKANVTFEALAKSYHSLGIDITQPIGVVSQIQVATKNGIEIPNVVHFPYNLALIFYFKAILLICSSHDKISAKCFFQSSAAISQIYSEVFEIQNFQLFDLEIQSVRYWAIREIEKHCL